MTYFIIFVLLFSNIVGIYIFMCKYSEQIHKLNDMIGATGERIDNVRDMILQRMFNEFEKFSDNNKINTKTDKL